MSKVPNSNDITVLYNSLKNTTTKNNNTQKIKKELVENLTKLEKQYEVIFALIKYHYNLKNEDVPILKKKEVDNSTSLKNITFDLNKFDNVLINVLKELVGKNQEQQRIVF